MAELSVQAVRDNVYQVTVAEVSSSTSHEVSVSNAEVTRLGGGVTAEALLEASFRFLLEREAKESILGRFDLSVISEYFPEYESRIGDYL